MDLCSLILPSDVLRDFSLVRFEETPAQVDLYLDELGHLPEGNHIYLSKGFTPYSTVQDYPLRGRAVYLHIRRRRWQERSTGDIIVRRLEIAHEGTRLSKEFAAFLKRSALNHRV